MKECVNQKTVIMLSLKIVQETAFPVSGNIQLQKS